MKHLFTPEGEAALAGVMQREPLLAFDFDGTLAPIVDLPDDAIVPLPVALALARLALLHPVAIVTGRQAADVPARLGFMPDYIVGNHGAEDGGGDASQADRTAMDVLRRRLAARSDALAAQGVLVEDKQYSLAVHYRLAADHAAAERLIDGLLADLDPRLRRFGGKLVVNIVGADAPDKGDAVQRLVAQAGAGAAVFVGDDLNDEAVFATAQPHWLTVRVGGDAPQSRAMYCLHSHSEVLALLLRMLEMTTAAAEGN